MSGTTNGISDSSKTKQASRHSRTVPVYRLSFLSHYSLIPPIASSSLSFPYFSFQSHFSLPKASHFCFSNCFIFFSSPKLFPASRAAGNPARIASLPPYVYFLPAQASLISPPAPSNTSRPPILLLSRPLQGHAPITFLSPTRTPTAMASARSASSQKTSSTSSTAQALFHPLLHRPSQTPHLSAPQRTLPLYLFYWFHF